MGKFLVHRFTQAIIIAMIAWVGLTVLVHLLPGDPLSSILQDKAPPPEIEAQMRAYWGVDQPLSTTLLKQFSGLFRGDLGVSFTEQRPVLDVIGEHIGPTLLLGSLTLLIDFLIGMALGVWSALRPATWRARWISGAAIAGYALPSFAIGMVLIWIFAIQIPLFRAGGMSDPFLRTDAGFFTVLVDRATHLALPLLTMVLATVAIPLRQQRAAALNTATAPWLLAARARGVSPLRIAFTHCWRPALTPMVTLLGLWLPMLVTGAVLVEQLFAWPGLGSLLANATLQRDLPLVIGAGLIIIVMVQLGSLLADLLYRVVDPAQQSQ